ncbi:phage minor structural protein [Clostridium disporicum]|uniref:Phage minor structural protein n=1 Tax=Clostridium disporicum TaxID=84024 RepID=A0A174GWT8_9CLOT|nr:phage minor structural protein [Clostridium disporicum]
MFDTTNETITDCINLALAGTGWIVGTCDVTRRRTVRKTNSSSWDIIQEARKVYRCELEFDTLNKKVNIYEKRGIDKGVYFLDSLNLKDLSVQSDSYDFYTRIIAKGKDNLKVTLENFQYSNKIKTYIWKDERYTNIESLTEDAEAKLDELSKPYRAYSATIIDLANISKEDYKDILSYNLGDVITLVSKENEIKEKQRIVKMVEYPDEPDRNTCEIANTTLSFEDVQKEFQDTSDTVNNITTDNGTVDGSKINGISTEQIYDFEASVGKITDLTIVNARIDELYANKANISELNVVIANVAELNATKANITDLNTINANIQNLIAADATINNALIGKADITELNAVKGTINSLDSKIANIETLVNGNLSSENIQAGGITSDKLTIANGFITNAMIANLDVSKINAGDISTTKFRIVSDSGKMLISDNTIQIRDNNRVRVQIGKDASNDYNMYVWDSAGKLMFDATGLKADGIKNKIIRDDMISDNANIDGSKINISSLITEINKDTNTTVIKSTKVQIDSLKQTLDVAFTSLKSQADSTKSLTESHSTTINVMQGQIATAINNTQIVKDGQTVLLKDDYNRTVTLVNSINSTIGTHTTKIDELSGNITSVDTKVNSVQRDLEGTKSTVSSHSTSITDLSSKVSTQGTSISQLQNQIKLKVESTEVNTIVNGAISKTAKSLDVMYYLSTSATSLAGGSWSTTAPTWTNGKYMWSKTVTTFVDGSKKESSPTCIAGATGANGSAGKGIKSIVEQYYLSTSNTTQTGGSWVTSPPAWANGKYMWTRSIITYTDNSTTTTNPVCVSGSKGDTGAKGDKGATGAKGDTGVGISSVDVEYYLSTSATSLAGGSWSTTAPAWVNGKYMWSRTKTVTTTGSTTYSNPVCITGAKGATGDKGATGATGATGKGISKINNYYLASASSSGVTTSTSGWTTTIQNISTSKKYLWNYEKITYTDNSTSNTEPVIIGVYGDKGATGANGAAGKGIVSITEYYLVSSNATGITTSTSGWSTTIPSMNTTNKYLWNYEVIKYTDNSTTTGTPKVIGVHGATGAAGATGATGQGIASITEEYYLSTSKTSQTGGSWVTTAPTWSTGKYMWTRSKIVYKNPTSTAYTTPICDSSWEAVNEVQIGGRNLIIRNNEQVDKMVDGNGSIGNFTGSSLMNDFITVTPNEELMFSQEIIGSGDNYFRYCFYANDKKTVIRRTPNNSSKFKETVPSSAYWLRVSYDTNNKVKIERGNKATDWSPAPEDVDSSIANVQTQITTTSNKVATIETNLNSITQRVSSTESTTSSLTTKVNTAQSTADSKAKVFTSTPTVPYKVGDLWTGGPSGDVMRCKTARASGSYTASDWEKASKYTDDTKANAAQSTANTANATANANKTEITTTKNKVATIETNVNSITSKVSSVEKNITTINGNVTNLQSRMNTAEQKITPTAITTTISSTISGGTGSISTTQFVMDKNGLTINNGALIIKNKAGQTVLNSDSNGNISIYAVGSKFKFTATGNRTIDMWADTGDVFTIKVPFYNLNSGFRLCTDTNVDLITAYAKNGDVHRLKLHGFQTDNIKATYMVASKQLYRYDDSGIYWKPIYTRNENAGIKMIDKLGIVNKSSGGLYMQVDMDGGGAYGIDIWSSDINLKKNIRELNSKIKPLSLQEDTITGLELIKKIKHYEFDYDETKGFEGHIDCGYISQQLQEINSSFVTEVEQEDGTILLQPLASALLPHITKAMQQQQEKIEELENIILELKSRIGA